MSETRRRTRARFKAVVTLIGPKETLAQLSTSDLSLNSLYVESETIWEVGIHMGIRLQLAGTSSDLTLHMQGRVVRAEKEGMAIEFSEIEMDSFFHLRNIVALNSGDAEKIDREIVTKPVY